MKSTRKEVKEKIQEHIINRLDTEAGDSLKEQLQNVITCFLSEKYCRYERRQQPNALEAIYDYFMGLPSCFAVEYETYKQREAIKEWFSQTEEQAEAFNDEKVEKSYKHLILRELTNLWRLNGINFFEEVTK